MSNGLALLRHDAPVRPPVRSWVSLQMSGYSPTDLYRTGRTAEMPSARFFSKPSFQNNVLCSATIVSGSGAIGFDFNAACSLLTAKNTVSPAVSAMAAINQWLKPRARSFAQASHLPAQPSDHTSPRDRTIVPAAICDDAIAAQDWIIRCLVQHRRLQGTNRTTVRSCCGPTNRLNGGNSHAACWSLMVPGCSPYRRYRHLDAVFLAREAMMKNPPVQTPPHCGPADYRNFMVRELLIWLVGVPVPIAAVIGFFVL